MISNIINTATGNTHDATVTSIGFEGGARVLGIGPVSHETFDLVSNKSGQIQLFKVGAKGYYTDGLLGGDEDVIRTTDRYLSLNENILPQDDSFMVHQAGLAITNGNVDGGRIAQDVDRYGGKSVNYSSSAGLFDIISANGSYGFGIEDGGQTRSGVEATTLGAGMGFSISPVTVAAYVTEADPVFNQPIQLPKPLIPVCQAVGACGN